MFLPGMASEEIYKKVMSYKQEIQKEEFKIFKESCKKALRGKSTFPYNCYGSLTTKNSNQYLIGIELNNSKTAIDGRAIKRIKDCKQLAILKIICLFRYKDGHYGVYCPNIACPGLFIEMTNHFLIRYAERTNLIYNNEIDIIKAFFSNNICTVASNEYTEEELKLCNIETGKRFFCSCRDGLIPVMIDDIRKMSIFLTFIDSDSLTKVKQKHDFDYNNRIDNFTSTLGKSVYEITKNNKRA